ncbi:dihydrofolate reductase [Jiulongibacter sp. NS-SX5]|uniref:dihydrofolate reductase n=1 Tax=Jiulongibacter sp. NS-SX5 TaxID=3463854 RepID=UPI0040585FA6
MSIGPKISIIAAMSLNRSIGYQGSLPWPEPIPVDWENLEKVTRGCKMIMGRKSYEDKHRVSSAAGNIVVTSKEDYSLDEGFQKAASLQEALLLYQNEAEVYVIGGESLFKEAIPLADKIVLTLVEKEFEGDTFFPAFEHLQFKNEEKKHFEISDQTPYPLQIITYRKA